MKFLIRCMKLSELEEAFSKINLPKELPEFKIVDLPLFVSSHIAILKAHSGKKWFIPYYYRLLKVFLYLKAANDQRF